MPELHVNEVTGPVTPDQDARTLFITCASFEPRSQIVSTMVARDGRWVEPLLFYSREYAERGLSRVHRIGLQAELERFSGRPASLVPFELDSPAKSLRSIRDVLASRLGDGLTTSVVCDISTFPRQEFIVLMKLLRQGVRSSSIHIYYTDAGTYDSERDEGWLTRGVRSVTPVIGFGGVQAASKRKLLLMILGHEPERAAVTWKRHQPSRLLLAKTDTRADDSLRKAVDRLEQEMMERVTNAEVVTSLPARGVAESRDLVLHIARANAADYYTIVAPLGTKLQTLGVTLAALEEPRIQLTYAVPSVYNYSTYSRGHGRVWKVSGLS